MGVASSSGRRLAHGTLALAGSALGAAAFAQTPTTQAPPPPPADTTTIVEVPEDVPPEAPDQPAQPETIEPDAPEQKSPEHVEQDVSGFRLSTLETKNLSLLYFDPVQTYLTPYLGRAFENALAFHKKSFRWEPWDRTTVLLKDFSDYGNAAARASPNNMVLLDVAPLSLSMETFSPGERFFTLINHELAHVAAMDVWNSKDASWRRFLGGKPMPIQEHPESILYNFLTTPRNMTPRWYMEGSAVFFETWMAGGLGRAQGAYDEMVFRAKVRDKISFFSPLGLESEGTQVDFQVGANDYLYGTRFFSYLALTYGPEKVVEWLRRVGGCEGLLRKPVQACVRKPLDDVWDDWNAFEHEFQEENLAGLARYPLTEVRHLSPRGLGSMSRGFIDEKTNSLIAAFRYPGRIGFVGRMDLATGKLAPLTELKGMMLYKVTSVAFDPSTRKAYYTDENYAFREIKAINVDTGKKRMLLTRRADRRPRLQPCRQVPVGHSPPERLRDHRPHPAALRQLQPGPDVPVWRDPVRSRHLARRRAGRRVIWKSTASSRSEFGSGPTWNWAMPTIPSLPYRFRPPMPENFTFTPDGKALLGNSYYTGVSNVFRFDIASGKYEVLTNASTGFFRPQLRPDGSLFVYEYTGEGFNPSFVRPKVRDDLGTVEFLGTEVVKARPELKDWGVGSPAKVPLDDLITQRGTYNPPSACVSLRITRSSRATTKVALGYYFHFEDPLQFHQLSASVAVSPYKVKGGERLHCRHGVSDAQLEASLLAQSGRRLRSCRAGAAQPQGRRLQRRLYEALIYDPPRQLDMFGSVAAYFGLEQLPGAQNIPSPKDHAFGRARRPLHQHPQGAGRRRS